MPGRRHSRCRGGGLRCIREQGETGRTASRHLRELSACAVPQRLEQHADLGTEMLRRRKKVIAVLDNLPRRPSVRGNDVLRKTVPTTGEGAEHGRGRQHRVRPCKNDMPVRGRVDGIKDVPDPSHTAGHAGKADRHIGAEIAGESGKRFRIDPMRRLAIQKPKHRCGIARPAAKTGADRNILLNRDGKRPDHATDGAVSVYGAKADIVRLAGKQRRKRARHLDTVVSGGRANRQPVAELGEDDGRIQ